MGDLLISTGTFYPDIGGPPTYLRQLADQLFKENIRLEVLTFGDPAPEKRKNLNYPVRYVTRFLPMLIRVGIYTVILFFKVLRARHWYVNDYGFPAWLVGRVTGKKYILKVVGDFAWEWSGRHLGYRDSIDAFQLRRPHWLSRFLQAIQKTYVGYARQIVVPSQYLKKILMGWGIDGTQIQVIYNAVQVPAPDAHQVIQLEKIAPAETVFCSVARLVPWKGIDRVLEALGQLRHLEFRYLIVGEGPDRQRLESIATQSGLAGKVFFLGAKTAAEVSAILSRSKLFILLSQYEGLPHVILEALAHQVPCLTSDRGGFPEVITPQNGLMLALEQEHFTERLKTILEEFIAGKSGLNKLLPVAGEVFRFEKVYRQMKTILLTP